MNDLEFEVTPGLCASELHDPEERQKRYLCVRLSAVSPSVEIVLICTRQAWTARFAPGGISRCLRRRSLKRRRLSQPARATRMTYDSLS
jgi:hypothetical protein